MFLSEMKVGQKKVVIKINDNGVGFKRLKQLGLTKGVVVELVRVAPFGDPIEIKLRGFYLALRKVQANKIVVGENE